MRLYDAFTKTGGSYKRWDGTFGIEIETETLDEYATPRLALWDVHNDGSLRNFGREYVLKTPLSFGAPLDTALEEFKNSTSHLKFIQDSISTSVHVHVNMLNEDFRTFANFVTVYTLVENLLIRFSGPDRKSNLFCLPIVDAEETYRNIKTLFQNFEKKNFKAIHHMDAANCKYAALNLASLARFGSLEIRSFRGVTDTKIIRNWVGIIDRMLQYSRQAGLYPADIIVQYKDRGPEVLSEIFGEYRELLRWDDEDRLLTKSLFFAASNAYTVKDWDKVDAEPKAVATKKSPDLDGLSMKAFGARFHELTGDQQMAVIDAMERAQNRPFVNDFGEDADDAEVRQPRPIDPMALRNDLVEDRAVPRRAPPPIPRPDDWFMPNAVAGRPNQPAVGNAVNDPAPVVFPDEAEDF